MTVPVSTGHLWIRFNYKTCNSTRWLRCELLTIFTVWICGYVESAELSWSAELIWKCAVNGWVGDQQADLVLQLLIYNWLICIIPSWRLIYIKGCSDSLNNVDLTKYHLYYDLAVDQQADLVLHLADLHTTSWSVLFHHLYYDRGWSI